MPNFYYRSQFVYSNVKDLTHLHMTVSFGATGAPTIVSGTGMGITSITRISAGVYDIRLDQAFTHLLGIRNTFVSSGAPASPSMYISSDASNVAAAPIIRVVFNAAGTATDPASGEKALMKLEFTKSSVAY